MTIRKHLSLAVALALTPVAAMAQTPTLTEGRCGELVTLPTGKTDFIVDPNLHVLNGPDKLTPSVPAGDTVSGIMCGRNSLAMDTRDDRVLVDLKMPLFLSRDTPEGMAVLELSKGQYEIRLLKGALTPDEAQADQQRLNEFQTRAQDAYVKAHPK